MDEQINGMVETIRQLEKENAEILAALVEARDTFSHIKKTLGFLDVESIAYYEVCKTLDKINKLLENERR